MDTDLLPVSLDPFCVILVLREVDIQLVFSSHCHRWLAEGGGGGGGGGVLIYSFVYVYII